MTSTADSFYFIDTRVPGWPALVDALPPGAAWYLLDGTGAGLARIAAVLAEHSGVAAVHIVSHGGGGAVQLGDTVLTAASLPEHAAALAAIGAALAPDGDILLYGCDAGAGTAGAALVDTLAALTGADVAASVDATGAGGDWLLERASGHIDAAVLGGDGALAGFAGTLGTVATFNFTSNVVADTTIDGAGTAVARQTVNGNTLTLTANAGYVSVVDEDAITATQDAVMDGKIFAVDAAAATAPTKLTLALDSGKVFDFTSLSVLDLTGTLNTMVVKTNKGQVTVNVLADGLGHTVTMPNNPVLQGVAWVELSDPDSSDLLVLEFDDIVLSNITNPPAFVGGSTTISATQNGGTINLAGSLHVSDPDVGETLTWSTSTAPTHGTLTLTGTTAAAGGADITPGGTLTYAPAAGFAGVDTFTVRVSDGFATALRTFTVNVAPQQPGTPDLAAGSDTGSSSTDNVTAAATLNLSGTSAAGDTTSTVRVFIDVNGNGTYDGGTDASATATVANGGWSVSGLATAGLNGTYNVYAIVTAGALTSTTSGALAVTIDHAAPTTSFSAIALSNDSGVAGDFITNTAAQTITATLSGAPGAGDTLRGSLDNGGTWTDITAMVSGTTLTWTGATLVAGGGIRLQALDQHGNAGTAASQAYTLDTGVPAQTIASAALLTDSGTPGDFITNVAAQNLAGTLSAPTAANDIVEVSLNNGGTWTTATNTTGNATWSLTGITLPASGTLQVRVSDTAGNHGTAWTQAYRVDAVAPVSGTPVRPNLVDPVGSDFTFAITYAETGTGLDLATIGTGNVGVTGPGGALTVTGAAVSGNTVTYTVAAPGGAWDPADAGSYTIAVNASVRDLAGNTVAANAAAHTFTVSANTPPALGGVFATPATGDDTPVAPFGGVTVTDANGTALTLTIAYTAANGTLAGTGLSGSAGNYTLTDTPAALQAALRSLVFTPTANQGTSPVATAFTLTVSDGVASATNGATTVTASPVAPQVASIVLSDAALAAGETATLTVTFSERVTGFTAADLTLENGTLGALASGDGGRTWSAVFTPAAGIADATNVITVDLTGVADLSGLAGSGTAQTANYTVGTVRPSATVAVDDTTLDAGETATVTVTFSEAVTGFDGADLMAGNGALSNPSSSDGGITWTATLTPAAGQYVDVNTVRVDMTGVVNAAGNAGTGFAQSNNYAVHTGTPPAGPGPAPTGTVDGVPVTIVQQTDPATGLVNNVTTVPAVTSTRTDDPSTPNAALADIPLVAGRSGLGSTLTVGLPVGIGLQASGPSTLLTNEQALLDLIHRIEQKTAAGSGVRQEMTGEGSGFLADLLDSVLLQTATVTLAGGAGAAGQRIAVSAPASGGAAAIGIVLDATQLAPANILQLDNVDFAAVVGGATLRGGAGNNIVVGDDAVQNIYLGAGDDHLAGGGGNDVLGSAGGNDRLAGGAGNDGVAGGIGNDTVAGDGGDDVLQGGRSDRGDWSFTLAAGGTLSASHQTWMFDPRQTENVALAELDGGADGLAFLGMTHAALTEVALLYQAAFGRAPDIEGLNFWCAHGDTARTVARGMTMSDEWATSGLDGLSDLAFVQQLYRQVLDREGEAAGVQHWLGQLAGAGGTALSRADVLLGFAASAEHRAQYSGSIVVASGTVTHEHGWLAGSGADRLEGGAGNDWLAGGDGIDTAVFGGNVAGYSLRVLDGDHVVLTAATEADTLTGIERAEFADGAVDLSFTQGAQVETLGLLYQAVLDRDADVPGIVSWAVQGLSTMQLAAGFAGSAEFQARYGALSDTAFVQALYAHSDLDAAAAGGAATWVNYLQSHTRAELVGAWIGQEAVAAAQFTTVGL